ncbi:M1 family aminopeptidase [Solirubrobacter ginsenosidimutans]|uniref:M1 family aminopeptidase n=1 Tax=Solirubrobacter ginsenosidimutans TaxID=490573 RepID=A0A9X3MN51_9ACTN|nr:M1 family aminopeptidase [Solirubrobacter ginsenosidimutans]MDA0159252.1 M1 family aminopeptidase [Solirubrobacter ginsenosidimutans]
MKHSKVRAGGVALVSVALAGLAASPALASPGVTVGSLSSLKSGAKAGTLHGQVVNRSAHAVNAKVTVRIQRTGAPAKFVGHTAVAVPANATADYSVAVKVPGGLSRGNYYLAACTPSGTGAGDLGCASSEKDVRIDGGTPVRGSAVRLPERSTGAKAAQAETCTPGGYTLAKPGERVYPEIGNTGYASLHSDVFINYDAMTNLFLPGTHVDLQQRSTQCLSTFSLDFDRHNSLSDGTSTSGPEMTVGSITVNGQPATFKFVQPTYPGDPNGQDDPDPLAHRTGLVQPINADNPNPPACAPTSSAAAAQNIPCGATKLVITPSAPIPSGTDFSVTVNYTGRPGVRPSPTGTEGWFRNATVGGEGAMVTSEPTGTEAWMPLNNHPSVKPTYDIYDTVTKGKLAIGPGRLVTSGDNAPDANFPAGSSSYHWKSSEPIANYLVENSVGNFDYSFRTGANDVVYFEAQDSAIAAARKVLNKNAMDQQEAITHFQEQFSGPFPFNSNGIVVALPRASFEEEMQTKIVFVGGTIGGNGTTPDVGTFAHENYHQWWGDNVAEGAPELMWYKEGQATTAQYFNTALIAANAAGGQGTAAGDAAFEASLVARFATNYNSTSTSFWNVAPSKSTSVTMNGNSNAYVRPGTAYLALRAILGKDNYNAVLHYIQTAYRGGSMTEENLEKEFHKYMPNQSIGCSNKLDAFFKQWFDTPYTGSPAAGNKPSITGPGLAGGGFYDANGGCSDYGTDVTAPAGGTVPATLSLTVGGPATFEAFTPGVAKDYTASTTANVISSAGDAALSVSDPGHLTNGTFSLPSALEVSFSKSTWTGPTANEAVTIGFKQHIGATDALRTGTYSKTLTFTLSTTTP